MATLYADILTGETDPRTPEGEKAGRDYFAALTIPQLRRRQDLATQQIRMAYRQGNTDALERLQATHDLLSAAIYQQAFG